MCTCSTCVHAHVCNVLWKLWLRVAVCNVLVIQFVMINYLITHFFLHS